MSGSDREAESLEVYHTTRGLVVVVNFTVSEEGGSVNSVSLSLSHSLQTKLLSLLTVACCNAVLECVLSEPVYNKQQQP